MQIVLMSEPKVAGFKKQHLLMCEAEVVGFMLFEKTFTNMK